MTPRPRRRSSARDGAHQARALRLALRLQQARGLPGRAVPPLFNDLVALDPEVLGDLLEVVERRPAAARGCA
jgi:hypothetical protein